MTTNNTFFNSIFRWQLVSTVYIALVQLATLILLGRFLPYKELGSYAIFSIVFRFALYSMDPGMFFSIIQKHESSLAVVKKLFKHQFLYIILGILVFIVIAYFSEFISIIGGLMTLNCILIILIIGIGSYIQSKLVQKFRQREINMAQIIAYTFELLFVVFFCNYYQPMEVFSSGVIFRFLIFYAIGLLVIWKLDLWKESLPIQPILIKKHLEQSNFNIWSQILSFVQGQYDTVVIVSVFGLNTLGKYILMTELSYMIFAKINPVFNKAIIPVVSKAIKEKEDISVLIRESLTSFLYLMFALYFIFWVYRLELLELAYPDKAMDLTYYALFLIPIAFMRSINNILISYIVAMGESKKVFYWNIIILIVNYIVLALFYIYNWNLNSFLIFGLLYAVLSTCVLFILLRILMKSHVLKFEGRFGKVGFVISLISLSIIICKSFISNLFYSIPILLILLFSIFFTFDRERWQKWTKFSII